ncbi:MAG TPA: imidazole glycerol phosphate synthase subunit HisH [Oligoflexia bacterium]|nr:imidazole glycerol phosphate synthase subunit HisH [Oligoflexia bacterium]
MSRAPKVVIVRTGIANTASIIAALTRAGAAAVLSEDLHEIASAEKLVLPGVGAFGAGMETLRRIGIVDVLRDRISQSMPTFAVCLGLQLLFAGSEETPGIEGIAVFDGKIRRFPGTVRVPQLGWNKVLPDAGCVLLQPGYAYFANSYYASGIPAQWSTAYAMHGERFVAGFERGAVLCCQFHPELSGVWGEGLIKRWLDV